MGFRCSSGWFVGGKKIVYRSGLGCSCRMSSPCQALLSPSITRCVRATFFLLFFCRLFSFYPPHPAQSVCYPVHMYIRCSFNHLRFTSTSVTRNYQACILNSGGKKTIKKIVKALFFGKVCIAPVRTWAKCTNFFLSMRKMRTHTLKKLCKHQQRMRMAWDRIDSILFHVFIYTSRVSIAQIYYGLLVARTSYLIQFNWIIIYVYTLCVVCTHTHAVYAQWLNIFITEIAKIQYAKRMDREKKKCFSEEQQQCNQQQRIALFFHSCWCRFYVLVIIVIICFFLSEPCVYTWHHFMASAIVHCLLLIHSFHHSVRIRVFGLMIKVHLKTYIEIMPKITNAGPLK